jgi:PAS domain S-box-containing protein
MKLESEITSPLATLLLIDDDNEMRTATAGTLERAGYKVIQGATAAEALTLTRAHHPAMVLLDVVLPDGDGMDIARELKTDQDLVDVFIVLFSGAKVSPEDQFKGFKEGLADGYIIHPVSPKVLCGWVEAFLRLRSTQLKLRDSDQNYRTLADSGRALVWMAGTDKLCNYFNRVWLEFTGRTLEQEMGNGWAEGVHPDDLQRCLDIYVGSFDRREAFSMEYRLRRHDGTYRWLIDDGSPRFDSTGKFIGYIGHCIDINERKQGEEQIRRNEARLRSLVNILQYNAKTTQEFLDNALNEAIKVTESKIGYIYFYHEDRKQFVLNTWSKDVMKECSIMNPQTCYELDKTGIWGEAVRQRKPIILNDYQATHPLKKGYPEGHAHLVKFMTIPIFKKDQIVAVVAVANKESDYDETDVLQLSLLMDTVWNAVDIKQTEDALKESEERFHSLFDNMGEGVALHELVFENAKPVNYRIIEINNRFMKILGVSREQVVGKLSTEAYGASSPPYFKEYVEVGLSKKPIYFETYFASMDKYFAISVAPWQESGFATIFTDITDRKRAEEELRKLSRAVEQSPASIVITDTSGAIEYVNPKFVQLTGYSLEEVKSKNPRVLKSGETPSKEYAQLWSTITSGGEWRGEFHNKKKNGELYWESAVISPITNTQGDITYYLAVKEDITERKRSEEALQEAAKEKENLIRELQHALENIKTLQGLIPICASCKKIRDDKGFWSQVEEYIGGHTDAKFSHGICPDCAKKLYGDLYEQAMKKRK